MRLGLGMLSLGSKTFFMEIIHYSRCGYNGDYTYTSVCGKLVKSNQENENSTCHPEEANCKKCLKAQSHKQDLNDYMVKSSKIKRRIYIESDILHANEFRSAQSDAADFVKKQGVKLVDRVFSDVLDYAWHDLEKTWAAVKSADEIYAKSSLMPLNGGSYIGAPVIFNGMCERAIKENITGKTVVIFNTLKNISWGMIKIDVMKEAFKKNTLVMYNDEYDLTKIDVSKINPRR